MKEHIRLSESVWHRQVRNFYSPPQRFPISLKGKLQRCHNLISNDRIWPSEYSFKVIFEKSLSFLRYRPSKSGTSAGSILGFTRFPKIIIEKPSSVTSQVIKLPDQYRACDRKASGKLPSLIVFGRRYGSLCCL